MPAQDHDIQKQKLRAALVSVFVKVALTVCKFAAAALSGSLALLSEAGNNLGDVAVTALSFLSIREAAKPADEEHPFGHGKIEALSALIQTGFLFALAVFILIEAGKRLLWGGGDVEPNAFAYGVLVISIVVDAARWVSLNKIAKATGSQALAADALNFATDIVASLMALVGLVATARGFHMGDTLAAVGVALFVGIAGYRLGRETIDTLIDTAPAGLAGPVRKTIGGVPGVIAVGAMRLRPTGQAVFGDVAIQVSRTLSIERVAAIHAAVTAALAAAHPDVRLVITTEPIPLDDETVIERVHLVANRRRVPIHHVTVQSLGGERQSVSFDAEVDGGFSLGAAHDEVTALERAIADELGQTFEVESHIEPLEVRELEGHECSGARPAEILAALAARARESEGLIDVHDVRVRQTSAGLIVNYHCLADPALPVDAVHEKVDRLERQVRRDCGDIARIVGHAEPIKARDHGP